MSHDQNPNAPTLRGSSSYMQMANVKRHQRSWTEPTRAFEYGLGSTGRKGQHRALQVRWLFHIWQSVTICAECKKSVRLRGARPWLRAQLVPTRLCPWARYLVSIASLSWALLGSCYRNLVHWALSIGMSMPWKFICSCGQRSYAKVKGHLRSSL